MKHRILHNPIFFLLLTVLLLTGCMAVEGRAAPPDLQRSGSIRVRLLDQGVPVQGGSLTAFQAGEIILKDGIWQYALTPDFHGSGVDLQDLQEPQLAADLAAWALRRGLQGVTNPSGRDGETLFPSLKPGLYLLVQQEALEGYLPVAPFLVTVPSQDGDRWIYDVDATPKTAVTPEIPEGPEKPNIPQTGQLRWPVPVLAFAGVVLFMLGWGLYVKKDGRDYEA